MVTVSTAEPPNPATAGQAGQALLLLTDTALHLECSTGEQAENTQKTWQRFKAVSVYLAVIYKSAEEAGTSAQSLTAAPCTSCSLQIALSHSLILVLADFNMWILQERHVGFPRAMSHI